MARQVDKLSVYLQILKHIYDSKTGIKARTLQIYLDLDKGTLNRYLNDLATSNGFSSLIKVNKNSKEHIYMPAKESLEEYLKYYSNSAYSFMELLALESFDNLLSNDVEFLAKFRENFYSLDNPWQDVNMYKNEFELIKTLLYTKEYKRKIMLEMKIFNQDILIKEAIFLKIIYSDKNYYALIKHDNKVELKSLSYIKNIKILQSSYNELSVPKGIEYKLKFMNNAFSVFGGTEEEAILEISKNAEHYFAKGMKKFFKYQEIINDSPMQIKVKYTHNIEILRFIKTWLPDIKIISPNNLQEELTNVLKEALNTYKH